MTTSELRLLSSDELLSRYDRTVDAFFNTASKLKKTIVLELKDILEAQGFPRHKISARINKDLKGEVAEQYIREVLGKEYTDPLWSRESKSNNTTNWSALLSSQSSTSISDLDKTQLRDFEDFIDIKKNALKEEMKRRGMAQSIGTTESNELGNKAVTNTPLSDQQVTKPQYKTDNQQDEWKNMIAFEFLEWADTLKKLATDFVPSLKIESEEQARRWANGIKAQHSIYSPAADEKYRLSILDWVKILDIMKVHGSSAASKLYKKPIASLRDLDPSSLPEGFDKTLLAMKIDKDTDQVVFISPTKEHLDSRANIMLKTITEFINRTAGLGEFIEMLETEFKLRNFRAAVLSEKLSDAK